MIKTGKDLAAAAKAVAENHKTIYIKGCFGWPMTEVNKNRAIASYAYNAKEERADKIMQADENTFGFDCVCLIKALLWGWQGNGDHVYGGAVYVSNGVPDKNESQMIALCSEVSEDFSSIAVGEAVWMPGHIGIYIGDGLAVECTPKWDDGVQITAVYNIGKKSGFNGRSWVKHGKLPYVAYEENISEEFTVMLPEMAKGAKGECVKALQILLIGRGFSCGSYGADGDFGDATLRAVKNYQTSAGLTADGIAGVKTMTALLGGSYE